VTPWIPELDLELGEATEEPVQRGNGWSRTFTDGWAAVNLNSGKRRKITYRVPAGLVGTDGKPAPERVTLQPHEGVVLARG
jgi:hypothetical protein